jgi:arginine repressor
MTDMTSITNSNQIVYSLNIEDLQRVANEELSRDLNANEIKRVEDKIGDYISWYDAMALAINDVVDEEYGEELN